VSTNAEKGRTREKAKDMSQTTEVREIRKLCATGIIIRND